MALKKSPDHFVCPHCGAEVARSAQACPECGSDERTGWAEDADKWAAGLPTGYSGEDDFNYDEYVRREFGPGRLRDWRAWAAIVLAAVLIAWLVAAAL